MRAGGRRIGPRHRRNVRGDNVVLVGVCPEHEGERLVGRGSCEGEHDGRDTNGVMEEEEEEEEEVMRWSEEVMRWSEEVMRWSEEVRRWSEEVMGWSEEVMGWSEVEVAKEVRIRLREAYPATAVCARALA